MYLFYFTFSSLLGIQGVCGKLSGVDSGFRQPYPPNARPRLGLSPGVVNTGQYSVGQQLHGQPQAVIGQYCSTGLAFDNRMPVTVTSIFVILFEIYITEN